MATRTMLSFEAAMLASRYSDMPVVNAGDGGATNPTLTDLLSIGRLHDRCSHRPVPEG